MKSQNTLNLLKITIVTTWTEGVQIVISRILPGYVIRKVIQPKIVSACFKKITCTKCKNIGHIAKVCRENNAHRLLGVDSDV